jgi:iron-sulfur cluster repair protein YtfE (RIC family)
MLFGIGRKHAVGQDLVDQLLECHVRIRAFSTLAVAVGERTDTPRAEVVDVCSRVQRYFTDALPLHLRDEEDSVLPRLRGRSPSLDAALARMHEQHEMHDALLGRLLALTTSLRCDPTDVHARAALLAVARPLRSVLEDHLCGEEEVVFPAVRAFVSLEEQGAIVDELQKRRRRAKPSSSFF